jgi:drug/metabolite transporter (DMT)-like permease
MTSNAGRSRLAGTVAALVAVSIWAGWIPVTRYGVVSHLAPVDVAALRYGTSGLLMLPVLWLHRREIPWGRPWLLLLVAVGAGVPYFATFSLGLRVVGSGQAAVFGPGASSLFTLLIAALVLGEPLGTARIVGILCTLAGFTIVAGHDLLTGGARLLGFGLILAASVGWAAFTVGSRRLALPPLVTAAWISVANAIVYIPAYLLFIGPEPIAGAPTLIVVLQAIYQGFMTGTVAMIAFSFAVTRLGAGGAAVYTPLTPVLAGLIGWWLLGDRVDASTAVGLVAVAIGVVVGTGLLPRFSARR